MLAFSIMWTQVVVSTFKDKFENIDKFFSNPIYRAVRCDKFRISIMENILRTYHSPKKISEVNYMNIFYLIRYIII